MNLEPIRTAVYGMVSAILVALVAFGVALTEAQVGAILGLVVAIGVVAVAVVELYARPKVTPLEDPRDDEGRQLVPVTR